MQIVRNKPKKDTFVELSGGDVFVTSESDQVYLRLDTYDNYTAVNLETGQLVAFNPFDKIRPLERATLYEEPSSITHG